MSEPITYRVGLVAHATAQTPFLPAIEVSDLPPAELVRHVGQMGWEGIVWHHPDGRMAKLKARDFPVTATAKGDG